MATTLPLSSTYSNLTPGKPTFSFPSYLKPSAKFPLLLHSLHLHGRKDVPTFICQLDGSVRGGHETIDEMFFNDDDALIDEDSEEDDETESSSDLFIRFLQSMFKKVARRAKKASRSVLPAAISPQLVSFAVDGVLLLASLSIVKALLEVVCTLGGTVFGAILLLRVVWAAISYFQSNGNGFNGGENSFGPTPQVT